MISTLSKDRSAFSRCCLPASETNDLPLIIEIIMELADFLSSSEYRTFDERHKTDAPFMYHTLVGYIFNIFSTFIRMDKNPHTVRKLKIENTISPKEVKVGTIMAKSLMDQLLLCTTTSSRQVIFAQPTPSYYFFFPHITTNERKIPLPTRDNNLEPTAIKKK